MFFFKRSSLQNRHGSCIQHVSSSKRFALAAPYKRIKRDLINEFPDELLLEIFVFCLELEIELSVLPCAREGLEEGEETREQDSAAIS